MSLHFWELLRLRTAINKQGMTNLTTGVLCSYYRGQTRLGVGRGRDTAVSLSSSSFFLSSAAIQLLELVPVNQAGPATTAMSPALLATMATVASYPAPARTVLTATASLGAAPVLQASW